MAPHFSALAWKIPWTEEPGGLQSMGPLRVGHDWATSISLFTFMSRRRKWQLTPVFLPGESQGRGSLVGCHLWGLRVRHDWSDLAAAAAAAAGLPVLGRLDVARVGICALFLMLKKACSVIHHWICIHLCFFCFLLVVFMVCFPVIYNYIALL